MEIQPLAIPALKLIVPTVFEDARGSFAETYSGRAMIRAGVDMAFVQDNQSLSRAAGTVRGLHFQAQPCAQGKLVRVAAGAIFDVAADLRFGSPTYGKHVGVKLSAQNGAQLWIPEGFAHGFCTLERDTLVLYKTTAYYASDYDRGLRWDDPMLGIDWPVSAAQATLSEKDKRNPLLGDIEPTFFYSS